jgi:hypothetical protein
LHDETRDWPETNCYVDLWIELLAARGFQPEAGLGFTLAQDWEGDQFTFFKFPLHDLAALYGAIVQELSIYDCVEAHAIEQASRGRAVLIEVDGFYLPDTRGVSYRRQHTKTTIAVNRIDPASNSLEYFHNAGFFALEGEDYDGVFTRLPQQQRDDVLFPYVEFVRFDREALQGDRLRAAALARLREHYARPKENPVRAFAKAVGGQAEAVAKRAPDFFHAYASTRCTSSAPISSSAAAISNGCSPGTRRRMRSPHARRFPAAPKACNSSSPAPSHASVLPALKRR